MTAVTLHIPHPQRAAAARHLVALAGGDKTAITAATNGFTVDGDLAIAYLCTPQAVHRPPVARRPVSPDLASHIRTAETQAGVVDPDRVAAAAAAKAEPPRTRRTRKTTTAPSEEYL